LSPRRGADPGGVAAPARTKSSVVLVVGTAVQVSNATGVASFAVLAPTLVAETSLTATDIGLLVGAANVGGVPGLAAATRVTKALGAGRVIALSAVFSALSLAAVAAFTPRWGIVAAVASVSVFGVAWGVNTVSAGGLVIESAPVRRRALWSSLNQLGLPAGGLVAGILVALLSWWGWQGIFYVEALTFAVLAVLAALLLPNGSTEVEPRSRPRNRPMIAARIGGFCIGLSTAQWAFVTYLAIELTDRFDMGFKAAATVFFFSQLVGLSARPVIGIYSDWRGPPRIPVLVLAALGSSLVLIVFGLLPSDLDPRLLVAFVLAGSFVVIGWNGVMMVACAEAGPPRQMNANIATGLTLMRFGNIVGPPVLGALLAWAGAAWGWSVVAVLLVVAGVGLWFTGRAQSRPQPFPPR
jgi:MFS family permease